MKKGAILRKITQLGRRQPDDQHDTRYMECGHIKVVRRATYHPMTGICEECEEKIQ